MLSESRLDEIRLLKEQGLRMAELWIEHNLRQKERQEREILAAMLGESIDG